MGNPKTEAGEEPQVAQMNTDGTGEGTFTEGNEDNEEEESTTEYSEYTEGNRAEEPRKKRKQVNR